MSGRAVAASAGDGNLMDCARFARFHPDRASAGPAHRRVLLGISMANYRQARLRGAEASAIASLSAINQAQFAYMQTCGNQKFAPKLTSLGRPNPSTNAPFLSPDLTAADEVDKSGYRISMGGPGGDRGAADLHRRRTVGGVSRDRRPGAAARHRLSLFRHQRGPGDLRAAWTTASRTRCPTMARRRSARRFAASPARHT